TERASRKSHCRRCAWRSAVWFRHGGHRRHDALAHGRLWLSPRALGLTVSMALIGTIVGAISAGIPGQKWGGRETLRVLPVFYVLSALGCAFAWNWYALLAARFIGGLGIGGSSVLGPVYIAELAPAKLRGRLVGLFQINVVIGILLAYFSNYCIAKIGRAHV